jgi:4-amino-4-deoxy-L-arabinose transferase-like glycosyltransferase
MKSIFKYKHLIVLTLNLLILLAVKWNHLNDPYFWDEMGVYGNGVQYMYENGIGLHPKFLPPEISRGHPLLLYAFHALVLKIWGNSFFVSHFLALLLSLACIVSLYILAKEFLSPLFAALSTSLLVVQNIFLAQSGFILPEIAITLICIGAFYFYFKEAYLNLAILLCLGVLIKESSIMIGAFLGFTYLIKLAVNKQAVVKWLNLLYYLSPLLLFIAFLWVQKTTNGWYFFPYHTEIVKEDALSGFLWKLKHHVSFIFVLQGRFLWIIFLGIASLSLLSSKHNEKIRMFFGFIIFSILLFSFAFYMDRYLLFIYPILSILILLGVQNLALQKTYKVLIVLLLIGLSIKDWGNDRFQYDVSLSYRNALKSQTETLQYLCEFSDNTSIIHADFPLNMALGDVNIIKTMTNCDKNIPFSWNQDEANILVQFNNQNCPSGYTFTHKIVNNTLGFYIFKKAAN